jgi:subfamily B ATP-binding cassette protein MsbA
MNWVSEHVINDLRQDVLGKIQSLSLEFFNRSQTGDIITRVHSDTKDFYESLQFGLSDIIREPLTIVGVIAALCVIDWQLTLFASVFLPLTTLPIIILGRKVRKASEKKITSQVTQSSLLVEATSNIRVIHAFGLEQQSQNFFRQLSEKIMVYNMKTNRANQLINPLIEVVSVFGISLILLYIFATSKTMPNLFAFITGLVLVYTPVKKLARVHLQFQKGKIGVQRLKATFDEQTKVPDPLHPVPFPAFNKEISFNNIIFTYGEDEVLHDISFKVPKGQKIGIAGESGSGKSTLVNLIFRFYDITKGSITLDGVNIRDISLRQLREHMALVSQEISLFDATIAENIGFGKLGSSQEEIEYAAKQAYAHDFIMQLPEGYQTRIGERGVRLSGGQRQRISIARAFVRNAPILILDEATASLDSESEAQVQQAIDRLSENRTVISIAHRLSTLTNTDKVYVLSGGNIIQQGTFNELLSHKEGLFALMARYQGLTE